MTDNADLNVESELTDNLRIAKASYIEDEENEKIIHCMQQQTLSKLSRSELEDLYYRVYDENIQTKRKLNNLDNKYKIMTTRVMRLSQDHKCLDGAAREEDQRQLRLLKQSESSLRAKLTVLRGQLASHTRLHSAALSKSHNCNKGFHTGSLSSYGKDNLTGSSHRQSRNRPVSQSGSGNIEGLDEQDEYRASNAELRQQILSLQQRLSVLMQDMQLASNESRQRINDLETELKSRLSADVADNMELIRLRRSCKQQEAVLTALQQDYETLQRELNVSKSSLVLATKEQEEVRAELSQEKSRIIELQQEIMSLTQSSNSVRELQEQLIDLEKENAVLKDHSNRLLRLSIASPETCERAGDGKEVIGSRVKIEKEKMIAAENCQQLENQLANLRAQRSQLQQELNSVLSDLSGTQKDFAAACDERASLQKKLLEVRNECSDLLKALVKPSEERVRLKQQLADSENERNKLSELVARAQNTNLTQTINSGDASKTAITSSDSLLSSPPKQDSSSQPQQKTASSSAQLTDTFQSVLQQTSSHVGDVFLALLEQTAFRNPLNQDSILLGTHASLQEKFIELCIPTISPVSSSTPLPFASNEISKPQEEELTIPATVDNTSTASQQLSSTPKQTRAIGDADVAWELDRCRELLRVQCNLNSMYKKEVATLNNIVKSLTTGSKP